MRPSRCAPWAVDPVLNRGVALEGLERWNDAIRCLGSCSHSHISAEQFHTMHTASAGPAE